MFSVNKGKKKHIQKLGYRPNLTSNVSRGASHPSPVLFDKAAIKAGIKLTL